MILQLVIFGLPIELIVQILGFSIGWLWGDAFSKFDYEVKYGVFKEYYERLSKTLQWIIAKVLDANHHFQYGLALIAYIYYCQPSLPLAAVLFFNALALGLIISDWKDYVNIFRRFKLASLLPEKAPDEPLKCGETRITTGTRIPVVKTLFFWLGESP